MVADLSDWSKIRATAKIQVPLMRCLLALVVATSLLAGCGGADSERLTTISAYPEMEILLDGRPYNMIFTTDVGRLTFNLYPQESPLAVNSLVFLGGEGFFDGMVFYRVVPGVLAEAGDPIGTGTGGPGYTFEVEPPHRTYARGDLVMANDGSPNSNGSRFYILFGDIAGNAEFPGEYTIVGRLKEDHKPSERTLVALEAVAVGPGTAGEMSAPREEITIVESSLSVGCRPHNRSSNRPTSC